MTLIYHPECLILIVKYHCGNLSQIIVKLCTVDSEIVQVILIS